MSRHIYIFCLPTGNTAQEDSSNCSSFGFMNSNVDSIGGSSFSFMKSDPEPHLANEAVEQPQTGFSFMSSNTDEASTDKLFENPTSFSFLSDSVACPPIAENGTDVDGGILSLQFASPSSSAAAEFTPIMKKDANILQVQEIADLRLNKTSLAKTVSYVN